MLGLQRAGESYRVELPAIASAIVIRTPPGEFEARQPIHFDGRIAITNLEVDAPGSIAPRAFHELLEQQAADAPALVSWADGEK